MSEVSPWTPPPSIESLQTDDLDDINNPSSQIPSYSLNPSEVQTALDPHDRFRWLSLPVPTTEQGERCIDIANDAMHLFVGKNNGYGDPDDDDLGSKGQWADMHRKIKLIRKHLWEGKEWTNTETFEEVAMDLIGHLLLTIDFKRCGK